METQEWILHIDGDAFFASVEVSRRPDLFGLPVVVGEERGIATALTYTAKAQGIKRGDPIFKIKKEYPNVTILSSHFELYRKFAKNLADILIDEVFKFEAYSIDECFATLVGNSQAVQEKVSKLKIHVQKKLGITYSFGVSTTKTLAKVASKLNKPNGLTFLLDQNEITKALQNTKVENIWGIGWATDKKLKRYKIETAYDFINSDLRTILKSSFNKNIEQTFEELCGLKHFEVGGENAHKKSIQSTRTFLSATNNCEILKGELSRNIEVACSQLRQEKLVTKRFHIFLKPKHAGQKYLEQVFELPNYTNLDTSVLKYIEHLFDKSFNKDNIVYKKSGVTMLGLIKNSEIPEDLFNENKTLSQEENKISNMVDSIRNRFGFGSICLASSMEVNNKRDTDYKHRHREDNYINGLPYPFLGVVN